MSADIAITSGSHDEIVDKVKAITYKVLRLEPSEVQIKPETNLFDLGMESLSVAELLTELEVAFDINIDTDDLSEGLFSRFDVMAEFVQKQINAKSAA